MTASSFSLLVVSASEAGMKLLRFLERRLAEQATGAVLHKWIRTGQVRVNSGRVKPFSRLAEGDRVRIPPFAQARAVDDPGDEAPGGANAPEFAPALSPSPTPIMPSKRSLDLGDVSVIARTPHVLVLAKPAGLACQPGSGHTDSLSLRLAKAFAGAPFIPAPAHRIDRRTSGLVVAGLTHAAQQRLHALFASGGIHKEYLAWVWGDWPWTGPCLLEDRLVKQVSAGREGMAALSGGRLVPLSDDGPYEDAAFSRDTHSDASGFAASAALAVQKRFANAPFRPARSEGLTGAVTGEAPHATLLLLRLFTGRTHQLRVQLASRGFPIIGDSRYSSRQFPHMLLHAFALSMPEEGLAFDGAQAATCPEQGVSVEAGRLECVVPPPWPEPFPPDSALLAAARGRLAEAVEHVLPPAADGIKDAGSG